MSYAKSIPGMVPGETLRNAFVTVVYLVLLPFVVIAAPFYISYAVGTNRNGFGEMLADSALGRLPGLGSPGWKAGGVAFVYFVVAMAVVGTALPGPDGGSTAGSDQEATLAGDMTPAPTAAPEPTATATLTPDALEMMETVFVGDYSKGEIKQQMDTVMRLYGLPITEGNYSRMGSMLVSLREETGVSEMEILICMETADLGNTDPYRDKPPAEVVPEVAALCTTMIDE